MLHLNASHLHVDSPRQGLYNLLGGCSSGGYEICELPACKWISDCCKYSCWSKIALTRGEKWCFSKEQRPHTVHLNVLLLIITFCRLKKIQLKWTSLAFRSCDLNDLPFCFSYFSSVLCFEMCFSNDPGKLHFVAPDTRWAIVWVSVSYSITSVSHLICNANTKKRSNFIFNPCQVE